MTNVLRVDASARTDGSHSRQLAGRFLESWFQAHPSDQLVVRDLAKEPPPHITNTTITGYFTPPEQVTEGCRAATALSDRLVAELKAADLLVISAPMYNFSIPSSLKAWIDHVVRLGQTFNYTPERGYEGLLQGKRAVLATSAGAVITKEPMSAMDFVTPYLKTVLNFIGISSVEVLVLEGSNSDEHAFARSQVETDERIGELVVG